MKKRINKIFFLSIIVFILIIKTSLSASEKPTVQFVYMNEAAPHCYEENGIAKGLQPEIVNYLCDKLGIQPIHKFYPWQRAQDNLKIGDADALMTTPTNVRFEYAVFGKENTLPCFWNLYIRKGDVEMEKNIAKLRKLADLKRYKLIDFIGNGWTNAFMKKEDGYNIRFVSKLELISLTLANGRYDLAINSTMLIDYWAAKQDVSDKIKMYKINWPWTRFHFVFMVSRKSPWAQKGLVQALDRELIKMKKVGAWQSILRKYKNPHGFGEPFKSMLDEAYLSAGGYYKDYDNYPVYKKNTP